MPYYRAAKCYLEDLETFLQPLLQLANSHMVEFFTKSLYISNIPNDIRDEIATMNRQVYLEKMLKRDYENVPRLQKYVQSCEALTLSHCTQICHSLDSFNKLLQQWGCADVQGIKIEVFMNPKKSHEVQVLSGVVAAIKQLGDVSHIIDIGDGKGYLSSTLALHHKIKVLGVDASDINTVGAMKRVKKLSRVWKGIYSSPLKSYPATGDKNESDDQNLYKQITKFVDETINFEQLVNDTFLQSPTSLGLVGLHTCGDLAPTAIKIYNKNGNIQLLCNVSCCYHLISEKYESDASEHSGTFGFPLSKGLNERRFVLGQRARMVGAQSVDRIFFKQELPNVSIFYRALLQVILEDRHHGLPTKRVGKIKKCTDFLDYVRKSINVLGIDLDISDDEINNYLKKYTPMLDELHIFYLLRSMVSPLIESLILTDRLLFLLEQGHSNSYLVNLFDPVISPRCYGLISLKEINSEKI